MWPVCLFPFFLPYLPFSLFLSLSLILWKLLRLYLFPVFGNFIVMDPCIGVFSSMLLSTRCALLVWKHLLILGLFLERGLDYFSLFSVSFSNSYWDNGPSWFLFYFSCIFHLIFFLLYFYWVFICYILIFHSFCFLTLLLWNSFLL